MFPVVILLGVSLLGVSSPCSIGEVKCSSDLKKICTEVRYDLELLPLCHNSNKYFNSTICLNGTCGRFKTSPGKKGADSKDCCIPLVVIRSNKIYNTTTSNNEIEMKDSDIMCDGQDRVICRSTKPESKTVVVYLLSGLLAVMIVVGIFAGWAVSYYYWAIRKPKFDGNLDELIKTRLETNNYDYIAPMSIMPNMKKPKPKQPGPEVKELSPAHSSTSAGEIYGNPANKDKREKTPCEDNPDSSHPQPEEDENETQVLTVTATINHYVCDEAIPDAPQNPELNDEEIAASTKSTTANSDTGTGDEEPLLADEPTQDKILKDSENAPVVGDEDAKKVEE